jgi:hypothetical protein
MNLAITTVAAALFVSIVRATAAETGAAAPVAPRLLTETGLYSNAATLKIDSRNKTFSPQYPLWSDGATKRRWVRLPEGSMINVADLANWELPVGTKFWKEFSFNGRKVETRFLWQVRRNRWVFASYAWNDAQTEAVLASESGISNIAEVEGGKRHSIPSISECRACHDSKRTEILGFSALQLSDDRDPNALHAETFTSDMITLKTLSKANLLTPPRPELVTTPPRIEGSPVTRSALGYLSANCGNCHNAASSIASLRLDLKYDVNRGNECQPALATTVRQRGHWVVPEAQAESRIINPGHPESSALVRRMKSRSPISQMPPLGTVVADRAAVDLMTSWVQGNPEEWQQLIARCVS